MALELEDGLFSIVGYQHVKPGKGKAFVRMRLKKIDTGQVLDRTFRADENVRQAIIDRVPHQYLYTDDLGFHFMNLDDYGQIVLTAEDVGDAARFLVGGLTVSLTTYAGTPIGVDLPASVELEVTYAEPGVKGDTRTAATKTVTLETGIEVQVPRGRDRDRHDRAAQLARPLFRRAFGCFHRHIGQQPLSQGRNALFPFAYGLRCFGFFLSRPGYIGALLSESGPLCFQPVAQSQCR